MNKKKIAIAYTFLFLFGFAFAFGFTMASKAQADGGICCIVSMCPPPYDDEVSKEGHGDWVETGHGWEWQCIQDDNNPCDWTYLCPGP